MKTQRTTEFLADTGDIFTAMLTGGGVRVYMRNKGGIDLPASHPLFAEAVAQTDKTVEAFLWCRFLNLLYSTLGIDAHFDVEG